MALERLDEDTESAKKINDFQNQLETNFEALKIKLKNIPSKIRLQGV